ncbi:uncharacterized protein J8A68_005255 [[Candida] subhashii]|uniref:Uncharacterized protein n=1 Tax=[Candida] subhashii TaxID=561895 RepID=A0A8J5Q3S5_9ASCO|nr:uncharacterized protein J8A68_005255 [[Candida] subhashii]KAG7661259.1 hypothetical protein J8A68_005255 [[Candida] subhashii]
MLRSQSISNIEDHRNSKSFFSAFRSKRSQNQLRPSVGQPQSPDATNFRKISRPLSIYHLSTLDINDDDKENKIEEKPLATKSSNSTLNTNKMIEHSTVPVRSIAHGRKKSFRNSMIFNNFMASKLGPEEVEKEAQQQQIQALHQRSMSLATLPTTTEEHSPRSIDINTESIFDRSSVTFDDGEENDDESFSLSSSSIHSFSEIIGENNTTSETVDSSAGSSSNISKLPRTSNLYNMNQFIKEINENGNLLPLSNRASIEFENNEIKKLNEKLNEQNPNDLISNISLIENIIFITSKVTDNEGNNNEFIKSLEDIDYDDILKNEKYYSFADATDDDPLLLKW